MPRARGRCHFRRASTYESRTQQLVSTGSIGSGRSYLSEGKGTIWGRGVIDCVPCAATRMSSLPSRPPPHGIGTHDWAAGLTIAAQVRGKLGSANATPKGTRVLCTAHTHDYKNLRRVEVPKGLP